ncbi:MAG: FAD-dependent oxidoreductase [Coriobacteriales bacterium]|jgi:NADPH-dependent glutamate synthase beta subunit-like oxidoreductase/ferredoxin|nr:FAD-dependent oxidoreductase [Coriobacteriales bacterium]
MSEIMRPMSFSELMEHALSDYEHSGALFGVRPDKFYRADGREASPRTLFGLPLATPIGPAAGPGSQLAGNILAAYLAGARFIELKTVQTMDGDELRAAVARPCINATDEGYNVEWSTELTVQQALEQYIYAWLAVSAFGIELDLPAGVIFNMSVGYSLEGIQSTKVDSFLEGMKNASETAAWAEGIDWLTRNIGRFSRLRQADVQAITPHISNSVTLSTLHGCPADEIERIAQYLLTEKRLHTSVKCNPTLLGYDTARALLDGLGYDYVDFDEHHFVEDLQFDDAVAMFGRLMALSAASGQATGAKITNTFPVRILRGELPGEEMYMSGRALFPLSITVAARLAAATGGRLPISYSGGADAFNLTAILETGIFPVTMATTLLKPGGYERLHQLAGIATACVPTVARPGSSETPDTPGRSGSSENPDSPGRPGSSASDTSLDVAALEALAIRVTQASGDDVLSRHRKAYRATGTAAATSAASTTTATSTTSPASPHAPSATSAASTITTATSAASAAAHATAHTTSRKSAEPLPLFDCAQAPCAHPAASGGCPIEQQIGAYLEQVAKGDWAQAFSIIVNDNVLPSITGAICDHQCQNRCTRLDCDDPLLIRAAKKAAAAEAQSAHIAALAAGSAPALQSSARVLVIGAGPAGLAAAAYLRRNGVAVEVREQRARPLGAVAATIPSFRISDEELALDAALIEAWGVSVEYGANPVYDLAALREHYDFVIIATGAQGQGRSDLVPDGERVFDALDFLERSKATGLTLELGRRVAVIGGGDVAMDCARAAARNVGVLEAVVVYRRTRAQMPAQREELEAAWAEGVRCIELHAPRAFDKGILSCDVMELGAVDASGRRGIIPCGQRAELAFDTVINAVGAVVDYEPMVACGIEFEENGRPRLSATNESSLPGVYLAGDCKAGPKTVIKAMADAKLVARDILARLALSSDFRAFELEACREELLTKKGVLRAAASGDARLDARRCLGCGAVCEICVDVCPNRANTVQAGQILHLDRLCNECGNCGVFCPTGGDPYRDKLTLFSTEEDFSHSDNRGFLPLAHGGYKLRLEDGRIIEAGLDDPAVPSSFVVTIRAALSHAETGHTGGLHTAEGPAGSLHVGTTRTGGLG